MIRRIIIICLVAVLAYYAGYKGLTPDDITEWFEESYIADTLKNTLNKTLELVEEKQVVEKAGNVIGDLKEKVSN